MIMDRENGRGIAHIKQRYDIAGISVKAETLHEISDEITELRYKIYLRDMFFSISVWRLWNDDDMYNFNTYFSYHGGMLKQLITHEHLPAATLDDAVTSAIKVFETVLDADECMSSIQSQPGAKYQDSIYS